VGTKERRERERTGTRDKILDAARELFIEHGYDAVTMRKVAQRIEYSPTAIYTHFKDKETLIRELCEEDFLRLADAFQKVAQVEDPVKRLRETGRAYLEFATQFQNQYRLMFMTPLPPNFEHDLARKGNVQQDAYAFVVWVVSEAMAKGAFREEWKDPELLAQVLWAAVHGVVALHLVGAKDNWVEWRPLNATAETMLDVLFRGILRPERSNG
jgi:AcrR family transcriptional regulator